MNKLLTDRQELVLLTIDRFGHISSTQLCRFLRNEMSYVTVYAALKRLRYLGLIEGQKIGFKLLLCIKPKGTKFMGSNLSPFTKAKIYDLNHLLLMNDCLLALKHTEDQRGREFRFITERELRSRYIENFLTRAERKIPGNVKSIPERIPDFVVQDELGDIAYEIELTQKASKRYIKKLERYKGQCINGDYRLVRYICSTDRILDVVKVAASKASFPKEMLQFGTVKAVLQHGKK